MKIIKPRYEIMTDIKGDYTLKHLEKCIRVCYKSENLIKPDSHLGLLKRIMDNRHESVLEHTNISVMFECNRGFSHELVRHRHCAFSQESTRYCNYSKGKFSKEITVIEPDSFNSWTEGQQVLWKKAMLDSEANYMNLINSGISTEYARGALPIDVKTTIVISTSVREWRTIFKLRTSKNAHPSMRQLMIPLLGEFKSSIALVFDDIEAEL